MEGRPRHSNIGSEKYTLGHYVNEYNKMTLRFNEFISECCVFRYTVLVLLILNAFNKIKCLVTYKCLS